MAEAFQDFEPDENYFTGEDYSEAPAELITSPRMVRASEFANREMKPRPWLVTDWIPGGQASETRGDGGTGKTTLMLQLCLCAVSGLRWLGQRVAKGPAIYVAAEDDLDELQRRVDAIAVHEGVELDQLADLNLWPLATEDPALVTQGRDDTITPTDRWEQLVRAVESIKPVVVVLDSRADVFGGMEVSRAQVRTFIAMLRRLAIDSGAAVILLAHPSLTGMSSGSGSSGSTHWTNSVRAALYLKKPDEADADPNLRTLEVVKSNYAAAGRSLKIRWTAGAFEVAEANAPTTRAEAIAEVDRTFLHLLALYAEEGRRVSHSSGANYAPAVFAKDPRAGGVRSAGFSAAMMRLLAARTIKVVEVGPPSRRLQQLTITSAERSE